MYMQRCVQAYVNACNFIYTFHDNTFLKNWHLLPFQILLHFYENIYEEFVCVSNVARLTLPNQNHPNSPHNPLARETDCNSLPCFAVAKCCSTTLTVWRHTTHNQSWIFKVMWHTDMCVWVCQHMLVWWKNKGIFFHRATQQRSCLENGKSWVFCLCLWSRGERNNEVTCIKLDSKGVSVFTVNHLVCSSASLPCRELEHAHHSLRITVCVIYHAPEAAAGWSTFLTSTPPSLLRSVCQN